MLIIAGASVARASSPPIGVPQAGERSITSSPEDTAGDGAAAFDVGSAPADASALQEETTAPAGVESSSLSVVTLLSLLASPICLWLFARRKWYRLERKMRSRRFEPIVGIVFLVLMLAAASLGASIAQRLFLATDVDPAEMSSELKLRATVVGVAGMYVGYSAVLAVMGAMLREKTRSSVPRVHRPTMSAPTAFAVGIGAMLLFWPLVVAAGVAAAELQRLLFDVQANTIAHETLGLLVASEDALWRAALLALVLIGAPIFEEVMYRGVLQQTLRGAGLGPWMAIAVTSALFALMHANVADSQAVVALCVLSLGFGWIYEKTGRLSAPIAMHMMFNSVNASLALLA